MNIANGVPVISYYNSSSGDLDFAISDNSLGDSWNIVSVDTSGVVGLYSSLEIVNGRPAVAYYDQTNGDLKFVRASSSSGFTWNNPITVDSSGDVGRFCSLKIVDGFPAISYFDDFGDDLKYIRATDVNGTTWGSPVVLDTEGSTGQYSSLCVIDGNPAVAYNRGDTTHELRYIRSLDSTGSSWGDVEIVDSTDNVGRYASLVEFDSKPVISYQDYTTDRVRVAFLDGSEWSVVTALQNNGFGDGYHISSRVIDGNLAISNTYDGNVTDKVVYRRVDELHTVSSSSSSSSSTEESETSSSSSQTESESSSSNNWQTDTAYASSHPTISSHYRTSIKEVANRPAIVALDSSSSIRYASWSGIVRNANTARAPSLETVSGRPAIVYLEGADSSLKYVRSDDVNGDSWTNVFSIATGVTSNSASYNSTSMKIANGVPCVAFYELSSQRLKFIRSNDELGSSWKSVVNVDIINDVGRFCSMEIIDGKPAIAYMDVTNSDVKYVQALDPFGDEWGSPEVVQSSVSSQGYCSLSNFNESPVVSYQNSTTSVRYAIKTGGSWNTELVASGTAYGYYTSIANVGGRPAISYLDDNVNDVIYARAIELYSYESESSQSSSSSSLEPGWEVDTVDSSGDSGKYSSIKVVKNRPAIAYYNGSTFDLKYARFNGSSWSLYTPVSSGFVGEYCSMEIVNGNPAISYYDASNSQMRYVRSNNDIGSSWSSVKIVDSGPNNVGKSSSLSVIDGRPAVSYYDETTFDLKYSIASDANGGSWTPANIRTVVGSFSVGSYSSLKEVSGRPSIAYYRVSSGLYYVRASDSTGDSWGSPITIDNVGDVGEYCSMEIVDGKPAVAYYDSSNSQLKFVRSDNVTGTTWANPIVVDSGSADVGQHCSLSIVNGNPCISYYDVTNGALRIARSTNNIGTTWVTELVDNSGDVGQYSSIVEVDGQPAMSYYDVTNSDLKYARNLELYSFSSSESTVILTSSSSTS
jgi:hypothetical protein